MTRAILDGTRPHVGALQNGEARKRRRRAPSPLQRGTLLAATLFLLPSIVGFGVFYVLPAIRGTWMSFTDASLVQPGKFVGWDNYAESVSDEAFWGSLGLTAQYAVILVVAVLLFSLGLAFVFDRVVNWGWMRAFLLLPWLVPGVAVGLIFEWILDPTVGIANHLLQALGLPTGEFLSSPTQALPTIALITAWRWIGYNAILLFAGMRMIPRTIYEAAAVDGAGEGRMFFSITLPLLRPIIALVTVLSVIGSFQAFDMIAVTTGGGPAGATRVIYMYIYQVAFTNFRLGYASAGAVILFLILATLTLVQMRVLRASRSDLQ